MDINATLIGQMITFILFVAFTMKFVWPPLTKILEERRRKIAEGLIAAEQSQRELAVAEHRIKKMTEEAREEASLIIDHAIQRAHQIEEQAREEGRHITTRMKKTAQTEIEAERLSLQKMLQDEAVSWAILSTEKLLGKHIDRAANEAFLKQLQEESVL